MRFISKPWAGAVIAWLGVIAFSSTSLAEQWAEETYGFLTGQSALNHHNEGVVHLLTDKGFHVMLFCVFALLLCQALVGVSRKGWLVLLSGAVVGSCSEYLQSFFPGRDPAIRDVIINTCGTGLGVVLHSLFTLNRSAKPIASTNL